MTVSSTTNRKTFAGNGVTTSFATSPVVFFDTSDLVLTAVTDSTGASEALVENTDYTVTGGAGSTGTVSLAGGSSPYGAPAAGITLVIRRVLPLTQDDDFLNNDINDAEVLEDNLDRLTMVDQQQSEEVGRALKVSESESEQSDIAVAGKAGYYLRRNVAGTAFELAVGDANTSTFTQSGTGAVERSVTAKLGESVSVKDFGAVGDGTTNDTAAITAAILACQTASQTSLFFPTGVYRIESTITLGSGGAKGIAFIGETATSQQGSSRPPVTFRWHGGALSMFDVQSTYFNFYNIAFENYTTATDVWLLTAAQHMVIENCSFVVGSGATRFSRSVLHADGNEFGYSVVRNCTIQNPAPRFLDIDGLGTGNGITPLLFENNIVESNSAGAHTFVYMKDEGCDIVTFRANTFNGQSNAQLTIVDTTDTPVSETIAVLNFYDNEIDLVANTATDRCFRLTNVTNINMWGNQVQGGGSVTAIGVLVNSTVTMFAGNSGLSIGGPFFSCDATSRVYSGVNKMNTSNTAGVSSDPGAGKAGGVLQVVNVTMGTQRSTTSTSYADVSGLTASITPTSETSKILVLVNVNGIAVTSAATTVSLKLLRGSTDLIEFEREAGYTGSFATELAVGGSGATYLDAPASASAVAYKVQFKINTVGTGLVSASGGVSTITLMEVAA